MISTLSIFHWFASFLRLQKERDAKFVDRWKLKAGVQKNDKERLDLCFLLTFAVRQQSDCLSFIQHLTPWWNHMPCENLSLPESHPHALNGLHCLHLSAMAEWQTFSMLSANVWKSDSGHVALNTGTCTWRKCLLPKCFSKRSLTRQLPQCSDCTCQRGRVQKLHSKHLEQLQFGTVHLFWCQKECATKLCVPKRDIATPCETTNVVSTVECLCWNNNKCAFNWHWVHQNVDWAQKLLRATSAMMEENTACGCTCPNPNTTTVNPSMQKN